MSSSEINFTSEDRIKKIRESHIEKGLSDITSNISDMEIKTKTLREYEEKPKAEERYTQESLADLARKIYRTNVSPIVEEEEDKKLGVATTPDTHASKVNARALAKSLVGMRNGGNDGRLSPLAGPNGGNTGNPNCGSGSYFALAATMSTEEYEEHIKEKFGLQAEGDKNPCWTGYKRKKGTKKFDPGSCVKEEANDYVKELEKELMQLEDTSWQAIDKVMRKIAVDNDITPKQLHKEFKSEHGMIPDEWLKENVDVELVGWFPLDEAIRVNKIGNVYEVSFMFRGGTQRLKFFWPEVGYPSREDMQKACQKFWPGARLLAYYPSHDPADNQQNSMVVIPAMSENFELVPTDLWDFMSEEDSEIYDEIASEEGEPITPVYLAEDEQSFFMDISDHDTGEVRQVVFGEGKRGLWDNIHAKRKRGESPAKKGDKDYPKTLNVEDYKSEERPNPIKEDMSGMSQKSGDKRSTESGAGMTSAGVKKYNSRTGGDLKTAVTTPPSKLKAGSKAAGRRKSFCARSRGWNGERGKAARSRWNC